MAGEAEESQTMATTSVTIVAFLGKTIASKVIGMAITKAVGVEVDGATVQAWGEQFVLGIFLGKGLIPEPTFEQKAEWRFQQLEADIAGLRSDITKLKNEMSKFEWQVQTLLY